MTTDTIKVCLTTYMTIDTMTYTCMQCDSLVFGPNGWMLMNTGNSTAIHEFETNIIDNNKMYDLLGKEFSNYHAIPAGQIYIMNRKKFIKGGLLFDR